MVKNLSESAMINEILSTIATNDVKDFKSRAIPFKSKDFSSGLHRFLWKCPHCLADDALHCANSTVTCTRCNEMWRVDGLFNFSKQTAGLTDLYDWSTWHREQVIEKITSADDTTILAASPQVIYSEVAPDGTFIPLAFGSLELDKKQLRFVSTENPSSNITLSTTDIVDFVYQRKDIFECRDSSNRYRFRIVNGSPMKWVWFFRYMNNWQQCEESGVITALPIKRRPSS